MKRRMLPLLCVALAGCAETATENVVKEKDAANTDRIESFKASDPADPNARLFMTNNKIQSLPVIHTSYVEEFINVPNAFGFGRMPYRGPSTSPNWVEYVPRSGGEMAATKPPMPQYDDLNRMLTLTDGTMMTVHEILWFLKDRYLVSTSAETPIVYLHDSPFFAASMHAQVSAKPAEGKAATPRPKRDLDAFEQTAVDRLKSGEELVVKTEVEEMKLVGAIRARTECLACHKTAQVGSLLGAFTYTLHPVSLATKPADCLKNLEGLTPEELASIEALEAMGGKLTREGNGPVTKVSFLEGTKSPRVGNHFYPPPVHNEDLKWLANFAELKELDLSYCRVSDAGMKEIAKLKHLKKVYLINTAVTEKGSGELKKALPNCEIDLQVQAVP